jgi:hypothetical protein
MEDVLDVYQQPYDPLCPVVCLDETNRQLIEKRSIPAKPESAEREDYEYRRCGVADLFVAFEPLACKRVVKLTHTRTAVDILKYGKPPTSCGTRDRRLFLQTFGRPGCPMPERRMPEREGSK